MGYSGLLPSVFLTPSHQRVHIFTRTLYRVVVLAVAHKDRLRSPGQFQAVKRACEIASYVKTQQMATAATSSLDMTQERTL